MEISRITPLGADVLLSADELEMINNALNWTCNGSDYLIESEFQTVHGFERETMNAFLDRIHELVVAYHAAYPSP